MRRRWPVVTLLLVVVLVTGALFYALRAGRERPAPEPAPPPPPQTALPTPEATVPSGSQVEFAVPASTPTPQEPRRAPRPRRARSPAAPDPRVQAQSSAPRLGPYLESVAAEIGERWVMPKSPAPTKARIPVVLKIARDGRILWAHVSGSTGDRAIDASIAKMIADLEREGLEPLPDGYPYDELDVGLVLYPGAVR